MACEKLMEAEAASKLCAEKSERSNGRQRREKIELFTKIKQRGIDYSAAKNYQ